MYDQSLERLIQVSLADGVLTEKEKEVICKKAETLGIDRDEIMVYVQGLLDEKNVARTSSKEGRVHICPNCGGNIPALVANCPECGHEIRDNQSSESVRNFSTRYMNADSPENQATIVESFPVPNNKEDLLEFMAMAYPQSVKHSKKTTPLKALTLVSLVVIIGLVIMFFMMNIGGYFLGGFIILIGTIASLIAINSRNKQKDIVGEAWETKLKEIEMKAQLLEVSDPSFATKRDLITKKYKKNNLGYLILFIIELVVIVGLIIGMCFRGEHISKENNSKEEQITNLINEGDYESAEKLQLELLPGGSQSEADEIYFNFLVKCVNQMCDNHEYEKARRFISTRISHFPENDWQHMHNKYYKDDVERQLNELIDNAENGY